jgi:hypothetical protein
MPNMYDMMYGGGSNPDAQQGYGRANNAMTQFGMQMLQGKNPFATAAGPYVSGPGIPTPQMQTLPYVSGPNTPRPQMENLRGGKRRIRIGNKTYEEVDDYSPPPPANAPPQY